MKNVVSMTKVIKDGKTYYNFYLFGVLVKNTIKDEYMKLFYTVREYCRANDIEIKTYNKDNLDFTDTDSKKKGKK